MPRSAAPTLTASVVALARSPLLLPSWFTELPAT
jgi:hypothetical protein